jgi:hypothetical protein
MHYILEILQEQFAIHPYSVLATLGAVVVLINAYRKPDVSVKLDLQLGLE